MAEQLMGAPLDEFVQEQHDEIARLGLLVEASARLLATLKLDALPPQVLELARRTVEADAYALWRRNVESNEWRLQSSSGLSDAYIAVAGDAIRRNEDAVSLDGPIVASDIRATDWLTPSHKQAHAAEGTQAFLAMPLRHHDKVIGTLVFYYREPRTFSDAELRSVTAVASLAGAMIGTAEICVEQSELVSTISHELRTPVAAIYGAALTLRRDEPTLQVQREGLLDVIVGESERLARIVDDILWASRLESGTLHVAVESCDAAELVGSVVGAAQAHLPPKITLSLDVESGLPPVAADPEKVRQVLTNLVDNGIKYSPDGGTVEVTVRQSGPMVRFSVRDEGLGIPATEQERIFEKFHRLEPDLTRGVGGTGLGLYITRELVRRMNGRVEVESREGEGSTFKVALPIAR